MGSMGVENIQGRNVARGWIVVQDACWSVYSM
jgi:hypothetical protein